MAEIYEVLEIAANGVGSGTFRMTRRSDEDDWPPIGLCEHAHETREEADACPEALAAMPSDLRWGRQRAAREAGQTVGSVGGGHRDARFHEVLSLYPGLLVSEVMVRLFDTASRLQEQLSSAGVRAIAAERTRQVAEEGWTPEHDDTHDECELALAAAAYILNYASPRSGQNGRLLWPWEQEDFKPSVPGEDPKAALAKAGALIAAEIDRLDRLQEEVSAEVLR